MILCLICKKNKIKIFHKVDIYTYYLCNNCQTLFLCPVPNKKQISNYYIDSFKYSLNQKQKELIINRSIIIIDNLKKMNPNGRDLLDIGSGYGIFLHQANNNQLNAVGIEPSKKLYSLSKKKSNLPVLNLSFEQYIEKNKNKKFDFITLIHTIEHMYDPINIIKLASKILNKNGIIFIETPNLNSYLFKFEKKDYTFLTPPDHIWVFSLNSFNYIISHMEGIVFNRISTYSLPEHFMGILKIILRRNKNTNDYYCLKKLPKNNEDKQKKKRLKYLLLDTFIAPLLTPCLNSFNKGSFLELYFKKA